MFQIVAAWNLAHPQSSMKDAISDIVLRGDNKETFLTGEFARKIADNEIRTLSVSNIADKNCPTRRDLYFYKGLRRLSGLSQQETWGNKAGYLVEQYIEHILRTKNTSKPYSKLIRQRDQLHREFIENNTQPLAKLKGLESTLPTKEGDTDWLLALLSSNGRAEFGISLVHSLLKESDSLDAKHIITKMQTKPNVAQIGISSPAPPDFIVPKFGVVGDIKTGVAFLPNFQLTCAGYALAYENEKKQQQINWGIIYFFPTRNPSAYVKPLTFAQIYIFPIDDDLRQWFLDIRDEAYRIVSQSNPPAFPERSRRNQCPYCRFKSHCVGDGLELNENE